MPKIYYSPKVTIICSLLIVGMLRLSYWQWERHGEKQEYISGLAKRIAAPIERLESALDLIKGTPDKALFQRYRLSGTFDFDHETIVRNRKLGELPGVYVITPLKLDNSEDTVLVNRGFLPLPLSSKEEREKLRGQASFSGIGLAKTSTSGSFLAPQDPDPTPGEWFETWLRVDLPKMGQQLPYPILPIYLELLSSETPPDLDKEVISSKSTRDDMFFMPSQKHLPSREDALKLNLTEPIPVISTIIPPSRHLGYVFEWAVMAVMTALIGLVLQLRPPKAARN